LFYYISHFCGRLREQQSDANTDNEKLYPIVYGRCKNEHVFALTNNNLLLTQENVQWSSVPVQIGDPIVAPPGEYV